VTDAQWQALKEHMHHLVAKYPFKLVVNSEERRPMTVQNVSAGIHPVLNPDVYQPIEVGYPRGMLILHVAKSRAGRSVINNYPITLSAYGLIDDFDFPKPEESADGNRDHEP
jgi:hypothetical protein